MHTRLSTAAKTSRIATIVVFMALIRCIAEVFRLKHYSPEPITYEVIMPFLLGGLTAAVALLVMTVLSYYKRYVIVTVVAALEILILLVVKYLYMP